MLPRFQERFGWAASLLSGSTAYLVSAAYAAQQQDDPHKAVAAGLAVLAAGAAGGLINHFGVALQDDRNAKQAERNHLVRRGMAEALQSALQRAQTELKPELASCPRDELFGTWFRQLDVALGPGATGLQKLFPLDITEALWDTVIAYEGHDAAWLARQPEEMLRRCVEGADQDRDALAGLLRDHLTTDEQFEVLKGLGDSLRASWDVDQAKDFAAKLLPMYRTAFASVFARGGPESKAIEYKGMTLALNRLIALEDQINRRIEEVKSHITAVGEKGMTHMTAQADRIIARMEAGLGSGAVSTEFDYSLESMESVIGRDREIRRVRDLWLVNRAHPVLIWGPPGVGKSTLARAVLRDQNVTEKFGHRRYELRCDALGSAEDLIRSIAREWFGLTETQLGPLKNLVLRRLSEKPSAILVDNFETLMNLSDVNEREASRRWLSTMAAKQDVWTIVCLMGHAEPRGLAWARPVITPEKLELRYARDIFCDASQNPGHAAHPCTDDLIESVDRIPHFIKLLGGASRAFADLEELQTEWNRKRTAMLPGSAGHTRDDSPMVAYDFAIQCIDDETRKAMKVLAWLPAGLAKADLDAVLGDGTQANLRLYEAALAYREGSPWRLRMLKPLRDYVETRYPASEEEKQGAMEHFLRLAAEGNELVGTRDGEIVASLSVEHLNALRAVRSALEAGNLPAVQSAIGLGQFSARTSIARSESAVVIRLACDLARHEGDKRTEASGFLGLGDIARMGDQYPEAARLYNQALPLFREAGDKRGEAGCLLSLGEIAHMGDQYPEAARLYNQALPLFREAGDKRGEAGCLQSLGEIARMGDQDSEAARLYNQALPLFREAGDKRGEAGCLLNLGEIARMGYQYPEATRLYNQALPLFREAGDKGGEAGCLLSLGEIARMGYQYPEATRLYHQALPLFRDAGDKRGEAWCLRGLGDIAYMGDQDSEAARLYNQALPLFRDAGDKRGEASCLRGLGEIARVGDQYPEAARLYNQALPLFRDAGDKRGEAWCLRGLGEIARVGDQYPEAARLYNQALPLFRDAGDTRSEAGCLLNLGEIAYMGDQYPEAARLYNQALPLFRDAGDKRGEAWCLEGQGDLARREGALQEAHALWTQALGLLHSAGDGVSAERLRQKLNAL